MRLSPRLLIACAFVASTAPAAPSSGPTQGPAVTVFRSGDALANSYRIPALVAPSEGRLFAVCEARKRSWVDKSPTALAVSLSRDAGNTWSAPSVLVDAGQAAAMDPLPITDGRSGRIVLLYTVWPATVQERRSNGPDLWQIDSPDGGETWSKPRKLNGSDGFPKCKILGCGPGSGLVMTGGPSRGRLIAPVRLLDAGNTALFSDDAGKTWRLGTPSSESGECQIAECADGVLMMNVRTPGLTRRRTLSRDGGATWSDAADAAGLSNPKGGCQASVLRLREPNLMLFSGPGAVGERTGLEVKVSADEGATWSAPLPVYAKASGYSCLAPVGSTEVGLIYEAGPESTFSRLRNRPPGWMTLDFVKIPLPQLKAHARVPSEPAPKRP